MVVSAPITINHREDYSIDETCFSTPSGWLCDAPSFRTVCGSVFLGDHVPLGSTYIPVILYSLTSSQANQIAKSFSFIHNHIETDLEFIKKLEIERANNIHS